MAAGKQQYTAGEQHETEQDESAMLRTIHDTSRHDESRVAVRMPPSLASRKPQRLRRQPAVYCPAT